MYWWNKFLRDLKNGWEMCWYVDKEAYQARFDRATSLASLAHDGQKRKFSGIPYIEHPKQVREELMTWGHTQYLSVPRYCRMSEAAILHDVLEDCPHITEFQIMSATDVNTLKLVKELTNPSKGSKASRAERKQMDRDHLKVVSWEAKVIKLIDRTCNLLDMTECPDKAFVKLYANESMALLDCLRGTDRALEKRLYDIIVALAA